MKKMVNILKSGRPKAIILGGPAASGKSTLIKKLPTVLEGYKILNVDKYYEVFISEEGLNPDHTKWTPQERSLGGKLMGKAHKANKEERDLLISNFQNIIIDTTSGSFNITLKLYKKLEEQGYDIFMIGVYSHPLITLKRNQNRDRRLLSSIINRTWADYVGLIPQYKKLFKQNFSLINMSGIPDKLFTINDLLKYKDVNIKSKPKTTKEQIKRNFQKLEDLNNIIKLSHKKQEFDTLTDLANKLEKFRKS